MDQLSRALRPVLLDLDATGYPVPTVEPSDWQTRPTGESAYLRSPDGSGQGVWVDTALGAAQQVAMVAEQVQEWAVEERASRRLGSNWPRCEEHPASHPMTPVADWRGAVWECPLSHRAACEIGQVSGLRRRAMSIVPVDERDGGWESQLPRFRVYVQGGGSYGGVQWTGGTTATYDVVGADVLQVIDWVQGHATGGATYSVALVVDREGERGLVWLVGMDGNDVAEPGDPAHEVQRRMLVRRTHPVGVPDADRSTR